MKISKALMGTLIVGSLFMGTKARAMPDIPPESKSSGAQPSSSYDQAYVLVKAPQHNHEWGLGYTVNPSNPYYTVQGVTIFGRYFFTESPFYLNWGATLYVDALNSFAQELGQKFQDGGFDAVITKPTYQAYAGGGYVPLSGLLNLFSKYVVPFNVCVELSAGIINYDQTNSHAMTRLGVEYATGLSAHVFLSPGALWIVEYGPPNGLESSFEFQIVASYRY